MNKNIIEHDFKIDSDSYQKKNGHKAKVFWFIGLSGSGKSTIADHVCHKMFNSHAIRILDGDSVRLGLNSDLGFSERDRSENLRRVAETAKLFCETGFIVLVSFITPLKEQREMIKSILGEQVEFIYVDTPLEECEKRDPKGVYKKARSGEIKNFTGIDGKFEPATEAKLIINPQELEKQVEQTLNFISGHIS